MCIRVWRWVRGRTGRGDDVEPSTVPSRPTGDDEDEFIAGRDTASGGGAV